MKKSATAGTHFNARVVECRLAAKVCSSNSDKRRQRSSMFYSAVFLELRTPGRECATPEGRAEISAQNDFVKSRRIKFKK